MPSNISCMSNPIEFHANGKLLITGEYLVLAGARALAMPVRFGQDMVVIPADSGRISWESIAPGGTWFTAQIELPAFHIVTTSSLKVAEGLKKLLIAVRKLDPKFLTDGRGWKVHVQSDYPLAWGLGSSSTLCSLVASWAGVNPFRLCRMISSGSGYDIACADQKQMIFYTMQDLPLIVPAIAGPALRNCTWFAYLGNKQDTAMEVATFMAAKNYTPDQVNRVSQISSLVCNASTPDELIRLVNEHEALISGILCKPPISDRFPGFPGTVKSLGAWGGDFAMFVSGNDPAEVKNILIREGFSTVFRFSEIAANP